MCEIFLKTPISIICFNLIGMEESFITIFLQVYSLLLVEGNYYDDKICICLKSDSIYVEYLGNMRVVEQKELLKYIHFAICDMVARRSSSKKWLTFHSSAVMFNKKTILMTGLKGSGKTTLLIRLLAMGGIYIGDEALVFDGKNIHPFFVPLKIDPKVLEFFSVQQQKYINESIINTDPYADGFKKYIHHTVFNDTGLIYPVGLHTLLFLSPEKTGRITRINSTQAFNNMLVCIRNVSSINMMFPVFLRSLEQVECLSIDQGCDLSQLLRELIC